MEIMRCEYLLNRSMLQQTFALSGKSDRVQLIFGCLRVYNEVGGEIWFHDESNGLTGARIATRRILPFLQTEQVSKGSTL